MELNMNVVEFLTDGGVVAVTEDVFLAELERRRAERKLAIRRAVNRTYYAQNREKITARQRESRRLAKENKGVALTPPAESV